MTLPAKFWQKVNTATSTDCWEWTAARTPAGYGVFRLRGVLKYAHRLILGVDDPATPVDHRCRNRGCVNPDHLEVVTSAINAQRGALARRGRADYLVDEDLRSKAAALYLEGGRTQSEVGALVGLDQSQVSRALRSTTA